MPKSSNLPLLAGVGVAVVLLAGGGAWLYRDNVSAAQDQADARWTPELPKGRLELLRTSFKQTRLLALDSVRPAGKLTEAVVLVVASSPTGLDGGAAMTSQRIRIDCAKGRIFDGDQGAFDVDGKPLSTKLLSGGRYGRPADSEETEVPRLCGGAKAGRTFTDRHAAQREYQTPPDTYETIAAARPNDPNVFAWLCSAGARGRWRETTPGDCDKALKLNPTLAEVHLDRAFLNLIIGKQAVAEAGFRKLLAQEPDNAAALFAQGLILAMRGDKAASKMKRAQALKIDPKIPEWIETRYGIGISDEYRTG
jgi:hypothetical protein